MYVVLQSYINKPKLFYKVIQFGIIKAELWMEKFPLVITSINSYYESVDLINL